MCKLLIEGNTIAFSPALAEKIGVNEALALQQVHYWLEVNRETNKNFHDGRYWTYNSIKNWHEKQFSFWSYDKVKRTFAKLEKKELLVTGNYNNHKYDQTKWYSIDYNALEKLNLPIKSNRDIRANGKQPADPPINPPTTEKISNSPVVHIAPMQLAASRQPIPENITENINTETNNTEKNVCVEHCVNIISDLIQSISDRLLILESKNEEQKTDSIRFDSIPAQPVHKPEKEISKAVNITKNIKHSHKPKNNGERAPFALPDPEAAKEKYKTYEEIIKDNISYDAILSDDPCCRETLNCVVHTMASVFSTHWKGGYIQMGSECVPVEVVKGVFAKIDRDEVEYFMENYKKQTNPIKKIAPYVRASLYRNHSTNTLYWNNRASVDCPQLAGTGRRF